MQQDFLILSKLLQYVLYDIESRMIFTTFQYNITVTLQFIESEVWNIFPDPAQKGTDPAYSFLSLPQPFKSHKIFSSLLAILFLLLGYPHCLQYFFGLPIPCPRKTGGLLTFFGATQRCHCRLRGFGLFFATSYLFQMAFVDILMTFILLPCQLGLHTRFAKFIRRQRNTIRTVPYKSCHFFAQ